LAKSYLKNSLLFNLLYELKFVIVIDLYIVFPLK